MLTEGSSSSRNSSSSSSSILSGPLVKERFNEAFNDKLPDAGMLSREVRESEGK